LCVIRFTSLINYSFRIFQLVLQYD
jgi:hypothetical protein